MAVKDQEPTILTEVMAADTVYKEDALETMAEARQRWEAAKAKSESQVPFWKKDFTTVSGMEIPHLVTPEQVADVDPNRDIGIPGEYPYTRGIHPTGYRGKLWTMRQFAGFGTAADTNQRFKYLLSQGQTGLSVAFHLPTLYGYDSDHHMSKGEVGKCGVTVDTLADMEVLFDGIPLGEVTTSMTINSTAPILFAMYLAVAEKQGVDVKKQVSGTLQNDILKEYIAQKEYIYPPRPSMRLITDQFSFAAQHVPRWNTISISGYHIREAGSTALQELAFTLRDGMEYVQYGIDAGLDVDEFAPRLSFFFNSHNDFFEEIAKFRAARQIWATVMRERYGAKNPRSWMLRFHTQTAGCSLTAQQPYNNVVRTTIQALAAVLGGTQSLHTNSLDETLALPTEENARIALRTQQILAHESGVINSVDPLGGSYFVEEMTRRMVDGVLRLLPADRRLRRHGGGHRGRLPAARDHGRRLRLSAGLRGEGEAHRRPQRLPARERAADRDPLHRRRPRREAGRLHRRGQGPARRGRGGADARRPQAGRGRGREHHAPDPRLREGLLHGRRDQRRPTRRLRHVRGAGGLLKAATIRLHE